MMAKNGGAILVILLAAVLTIISVVAAFAQTVCGDHEAITDALGVRYGESKQNAGLASENTALEVYSNNETGTWTILSVRTDGIACLVAAGEVWLTFEQVVGEPM